MKGGSTDGSNTVGPILSLHNFAISQNNEGHFGEIDQQTFTCAKSTIETLEKGVK